MNVWITADNRKIPFDKIDRVHLQNIINLIQKAVNDPEKHRGFLKKNSPEIMENIVYWALGIGIIPQNIVPQNNVFVCDSLHGM